RAAELFGEATKGWTLHQLRHSALAHAAEAGTDTPVLLARSPHVSVRSLECYARPVPKPLPATLLNMTQLVVVANGSLRNRCERDGREPSTSTELATAVDQPHRSRPRVGRARR